MGSTHNRTSKLDPVDCLDPVNHMAEVRRPWSRLLNPRVLFAGYCVLALFLYTWLLAASGLGVVSGRTAYPSGDFLALSIGGHVVRQGLGPDLYDLDTQKRTQSAILAAAGQDPEQARLSDGLALYLYPPFVAWVFAGLVALSPVGAYLLWIGVNLLLLAMVVYGLTSLPALATRRTRLFAGLVVSAFFPTAIVLVKGQVSFLILAALSAAFLSLRRGRDGLAGVGLGLALVKPQLVVMPLVVLAYQRRWRALLAFGATGLLLIFLSIAVTGLSGLVDYVHLLWQVGRETTTDSLVHPLYMLNWRGMIARGFAWLEGMGIQVSPSVVLGSYGLLSLLSLGFLLHAWRWSWPDNLARLDSLWALTVIVGMLVSPHLHIYDLSLWIIVGLLLVRAHGITGTWQQGLLGIGHVAPLLSFPMGRVIQAQVCATVMVVMAGLLWYHLWRESV